MSEWTYIPLLGAGFSRNWGGWLADEAFEYLLGTPEVMSDQTIKRELWASQAMGGFESALENLRSHAQHSPNDVQSKGRVRALEGAIARMFEEMNHGFLNLTDWEFSTEVNKSIARFLGRFDAIFTLNQDVLLEQWYFGKRLNSSKYDFPCVPGMQRTSSPDLVDARHADSFSRAWWTPRADGRVEIASRCQPVIKLHGSSRWLDTDGKSLLIMGGGKAEAIRRSSTLQKYSDIFQAFLAKQRCRLMVIGYGFRDAHINAQLYTHRETLTTFIVDPNGYNLPISAFPPSGGVIGAPDMHSEREALQDFLHVTMIGASRRPLKQVFNEDDIEYAKVLRFMNA